MIARTKTNSFSGLLWLAFTWLLVGSLSFMATGELFAAYCGDHCEDHCEESCQGCGDCILCLPSVHMIAWDGSDPGPVDPARCWTVSLLSVQAAKNRTDDIDHPPQNLL